jgi:hypothetical protein
MTFQLFWTRIPDKPTIQPSDTLNAIQAKIKEKAGMPCHLQIINCEGEFIAGGQRLVKAYQRFNTVLSNGSVSFFRNSITSNHFQLKLDGRTLTKDDSLEDIKRAIKEYDERIKAESERLKLHDLNCTGCKAPCRTETMHGGFVGSDGIYGGQALCHRHINALRDGRVSILKS